MRHRSRIIHERFIQRIWSKQYLRDALRTVDGKSLEVLSTGRQNFGSGPDFLNAKIKIDGITYAGDIEIHRTAFDWFRHQHQEDPHYNGVVLHVVLETGEHVSPTIVRAGRAVPVLVLEKFLSESLQTVWRKAILDERACRLKKLPCFASNRKTSAKTLSAWLEKLGAMRLELKIRRFEERLRQLARERTYAVHEQTRSYPADAGEEARLLLAPELTQKDFSQKEIWEQILYEGLMEGLGYSKNREPFIRLAQNATIEKIGAWESGIENFDTESCLFGISGLLPAVKTISDPESKRYVRALREKWKSFRTHYRGEQMHEADWSFFPARPSNFPFLRIAAAVQLIRKIRSDDFFRNIIQTIKAPEKNESDLIRLLQIETNDFWKRHYTFQASSESFRTLTALGETRIRELIVNTVFPVALLYARIFKDSAVRERVGILLESFPAREQNSVLRTIEKQVVGKRLALNTVLRQQGAIQLYNYFCSEKRCEECALGAKKSR
jgi:hypothetical protein